MDVPPTPTRPAFTPCLPNPCVPNPHGNGGPSPQVQPPPPNRCSNWRRGWSSIWFITHTGVGNPQEGFFPQGVGHPWGGGHSQGVVTHRGGWSSTDRGVGAPVQLCLHITTTRCPTLKAHHTTDDKASHRSATGAGEAGAVG